jgi:hypothetical protein
MPNDTSNSVKKTDERDTASPDDKAEPQREVIKKEKEIGGRDGPDPTRYGDWEKGGRCIDF